MGKGHALALDRIARFYLGYEWDHLLENWVGIRGLGAIIVRYTEKDFFD